MPPVPCLERERLVEDPRAENKDTILGGLFDPSIRGRGIRVVSCQVLHTDRRGPVSALDHHPPPPDPTPSSPCTYNTHLTHYFTCTRSLPYVGPSLRTTYVTSKVPKTLSSSGWGPGVRTENYGLRRDTRPDTLGSLVETIVLGVKRGDGTRKSLSKKSTPETTPDDRQSGG